MQALKRSAPFALPIKILQFGQGNFMRGFFDWQIDLLNERTGLDAGVVIVRPRGGSSAPLLDVQDGLFTVLVRGLNEQGARSRNTARWNASSASWIRTRCTPTTWRWPHAGAALRGLEHHRSRHRRQRHRPFR
jgi:mannitol-1-phosphate/altronate dehydrogenase